MRDFTAIILGYVFGLKEAGYTIHEAKHAGYVKGLKAQATRFTSARQRATYLVNARKEDSLLKP